MADAKCEASAGSLVTSRRSPRSSTEISSAWLAAVTSGLSECRTDVDTTSIDSSTSGSAGAHTSLSTSRTRFPR